MTNPIKENVKAVYKKYAEAFDKKIASLDLYHDSYDFLLEKIQDDASILDLACGPGNVSQYLRRHRPRLEITGVDISEEMIDIARTKIPDGKFIVNDICEVQFNTKFDCVICAFGIPYLDLKETAQVIGKIRQTLNGNGCFYVSFMEGGKDGYERQSFTGRDELFIYYHPQEAILEILDRQHLSVEKSFEVDYHEEDGTITKEIIIIGGLSHNKAGATDASKRVPD